LFVVIIEEVMRNEKQGPRTILIDLIEPRAKKFEALDRMEELEELVWTYGGLVVVKKLQRKNIPNYRTYIGSGKVEELKRDAKELGATCLVVNNILKPQQIYNLGEEMRECGVKVWDRIDLILHIFANHAQSQEAKLQIELATVRHMGPRIFGLGGKELVKQVGGIGTRGIGETNIEIMKRHLKEHERRVKEKLERLETMREEQRKNRRRNNLKTLSIVGYTNAGKTTLLNSLTKRREYVADKLFATLDTRTGSLFLPNKREEVLISDTIGFIQDLPPELISAFKSTLSETVNADIILHVVDAGDTNRQKKIEVVNEILRGLEVCNKPTIYVFNKIDKLKRGEIDNAKEVFADLEPVMVSAEKKLNISALTERIENMI
jgi:GTP-binding protein HflX